MLSTTRNFENLQEFIRILDKTDISLAVLVKALENIAKEYHIAKVVYKIDGVSRGEVPKPYHYEDTIIEVTTPAPEYGFIHTFETAEPATGAILFYPQEGWNFTNDEIIFIKTIAKITRIYVGRWRLACRVETESAIQAVTGLPNSVGYMKIIAKKSLEGSITAYNAFFFNLCNFSLVNKRFGQQEGTRVLKRYVDTIGKFLIETETLGHLGGDNFVALILKGPRTEEFIRLLSGVEVEAHNGNYIEKITISATAGVMDIRAPFTMDSVLSGPSLALSHARKTKQPVVFLSEKLNEDLIRSKYIEQNFDKAIENNEFLVYYQPKVNSVTGKIIGVEALTRWNENGKIVMPFEFIPVLEQSDKISRLDLKILELVCSNIHNWKITGHKAVPASVNFSRRGLTDPNLAEKILEIINKYEIAKSEIVIEVTETTCEEEQTQMTIFLNKLHDFGINTSIDDFGTGYSSLSVLREFPVSEIKIDRSFINRELDYNDEIIIRSIIDMAKSLGIEVITEGVEYVTQRDFLHRLGCDRIQGFLYDQPLPKKEFEKRLLEDGYKV